MSSLILQIILIALTAVVSINSIKKDLRSRTQKTKNEAQLNRIIIILISVVSVIISVITYLGSENDKSVLNKSFLSIKKGDSLIRSDNALIRNDNTNLRTELSKRLIFQSKLISEGQERSAKQLNIASKSLTEKINGSDEVPLLEFSLNSDSTLFCLLRNRSRLPVYNFQLAILNYSSILDCQSFQVVKERIYSYDCYYNSLTRFPTFPFLTSNSRTEIQIRKNKINSKNNTAKYIAIIEMKNRTFYEETISMLIDNKFYQALRILEFTNDKITRKIVIKDKLYKLKNVNWEKAFPLSLPVPLVKF